MSKMMTMKRKEVDEVSDDFSDFSLSSPARKIRRLDAELPPIIEEEDAKQIDDEAVPLVYDHEEMKKKKHQLQIQELLPTSTSPSVDIDIDNQERAMVLFKPVNAQLLQHYSSPSSFSVSLNPHFVSGLKNHLLWFSSSHNGATATNSAQEEATNDCMAVVPWVTPQPPFAQPQIEIEAPPPELMDIEDCNSNSLQQDNAAACDLGGMRLSNGLTQPQWQQQQQQQHCMIPQIPHNNPTPISWFR